MTRYLSYDVLFRQFDLPVIRIYHTDPQWGTVENKPGFGFHDSIHIAPTDPKIVKDHGSAFVDTVLEKLLHVLDVNTLYLCGMSATGCVMATYMGADAHDFKAFLIKDALLSHKATYTDQIEDMYDALNLETVYFMLEHMAGQQE